MPESLPDLVARLRATTPALADVPDDILTAEVARQLQARDGPSVGEAIGVPTFRTSNEKDAGGAAVVRAPESAWTKAATIGAPGIGDRYPLASVGEILASDNPLKLLAEYVTGPGRPRSVANADPTGIDAFTEGKGPMPMFLGTTEDVAGIRAYHGSPHDFPQFDSTKIGTGEGAQAYGHGLYFAEKEGTAKAYRDQLSQGTVSLFGQEHPIPSWGDLDPPQRLLRRLGDNRLGRAGAPEADIVALTRQQIEEGIANPFANRPALEQERDLLDRALAHPAGITTKPGGKMYEVQIKADPAHFLDWDAPLDQQSPHVQEALKTVGIDVPSKAERDMAEGRLKLAWQRWEDALKAGDTAAAARAERAIKVTETDFRALNNPMTGRDVYQSVVENAPTSYADKGPAVASQTLKDAGIPGIKYLDQGSRNAGGWHITPPEQTTSGKWMVKSSDYNSKGMHFETEAEAQRALAEKIGSQTRNIVVLPGNDHLIDILRKYGLLAPLAGASVGEALRGTSDARQAQ